MKQNENKRSTEALDLIGEEVHRMRAAGYTEEYDRQFKNGELPEAAKCYRRAASNALKTDDSEGILDNHSMDFLASKWPLKPESWKPSPDPLENLVKAGAFYYAELHRLITEGVQHQPQSHPDVAHYNLICEESESMVDFIGLCLWRSRSFSDLSLQKFFKNLEQFQPNTQVIWLKANLRHAFSCLSSMQHLLPDYPNP